MTAGSASRPAPISICSRRGCVRSSRGCPWFALQTPAFPPSSIHSDVSLPGLASASKACLIPACRRRSHRPFTHAAATFPPRSSSLPVSCLWSGGALQSELPDADYYRLLFFMLSEQHSEMHLLTDRRCRLHSVVLVRKTQSVHCSSCQQSFPIPRARFDDSGA